MSAINESAIFQPIIDALTAHVALLDCDANIVGVNRAWKTFSSNNDYQNANYGIGLNYLGLLDDMETCGCNEKELQDASIAKKVASGLRQVISGDCDMFQMEYPCDSPNERRWFLLTITQFPNPGFIRAVVAHEDLTALKHAQEEALDKAMQLADSFSNTIEAISLFIEKRDAYTAGHQNQVARLCDAIAQEMGLDKIQRKGLVLGAGIHDIGKISIPVDILGKPGKLSSPEREIIRSHPEVGYDILSGIKFPWPIADMVCQHHERFDGSGYPKGLAGTDICLEARIIAVADVFDAIMSHCPYRAAKGRESAIQELKVGRGTAYDSEVVDALLSAIKKGAI